MCITYSVIYTTIFYICNNIVLYLKGAKTVNLKCCHHTHKKVTEVMAVLISLIMVIILQQRYEYQVTEAALGQSLYSQVCRRAHWLSVGAGVNSSW